MTIGNDRDREAAAGETRGEEDLSRRNLVVNLLGFAAGGLALEALSGCAGGKPGAEQVAAIQAAASGIAAPYYADTVAELRAMVDELGAVAVLTGYYARGDGGGGVFYWDDTPAVDDGGTFLNANGYKGAAAAGWRRLYSGAINVRWFGAIGGSLANDGPGIQNAIDAIANNVGGRVILPHTANGYFLTSTLSISSQAGIIIEGEKGQPDANHHPQLVWRGLSGGTMILLTNPLHITLRNLDIDGENGQNTADIGVRVTQSQGGWGVSNYEHLSIAGCNKNAWRFDGDAAIDGGRNHFKRCTFRCSLDATGDVDHACFVYTGGASNVQDVFDHCEWLYVYFPAAGQAETRGAAFYVDSGTPRLQLRNCYTKAGKGITAITPAHFTIDDHYSEDVDFVNLPDADERQVLRNCVHAVSGGASIVWGGSGAIGLPLVIDGGDYYGSVTATATGSPVVMVNNPNIAAGAMNMTPLNPYDERRFGRPHIRLGRPGTYTSASIGAVTALGFAPSVYENIDASGNPLANLNPSPVKGEVMKAQLVQNAVVYAPTNVDTYWDKGRIQEMHITGDPSQAYTVTFNSIYLLSGGSYTHSGAGKLDIIAFRFDGSNWVEIYRSLDVR